MLNPNSNRGWRARSVGQSLSLMLVALLALLPINATAQKLGKPADNFSGNTSKGETLSLTDLSGKVVVLDFWASWCGPCLEEMPFLIELYKELKNPALEIVAINVDENPADMQSFIDGLKEKPPFPILLDTKGVIAASYKLAGMPTTVFLDRDGIVRYLHSGFKAKDKVEYREKLTALLGDAQNQ